MTDTEGKTHLAAHLEATFKRVSETVDKRDIHCRIDDTKLSLTAFGPRQPILTCMNGHAYWWVRYGSTRHELTRIEEKKAKENIERFRRKLG